MKIESISSMDELLVANVADDGHCEKCWFKDYKTACYRLLCQDRFGHSVYWTMSGGSIKNVPFIWPDYSMECRDIKGLCRAKIAELYKTR